MKLLDFWDYATWEASGLKPGQVSPTCFPGFFQSPGNEVDISPGLLQVSVPHVLLALPVASCFYFFAQNWKKRPSELPNLAYFLLILEENWDENVIVGLSRYKDHNPELIISTDKVDLESVHILWRECHR